MSDQAKPSKFGRLDPDDPNLWAEGEEPFKVRVVDVDNSQPGAPRVVLMRYGHRPGQLAALAHILLGTDRRSSDE